MDLTQKRCVPCEVGMPPLEKAEVEKLVAELSGWNVADDTKKISKTYKFRDFKQALEFTNRIGELAEREGHHPDIDLGWGRVGVSLTTHAMKGLSENDFILAAKIDGIQ